MTSSSLPRYDYYQTPTEVIVSIYVRGYNVNGVKENVSVVFNQDSVQMTLPPLNSDTEEKEYVFPLYGYIQCKKSTSRILGTKIELKLSKDDQSLHWSSLIRKDEDTPPTISAGSGSTSKVTNTPAAAAAASASASVSVSASVQPESKSKTKKNWDRVVSDELDEQGADDNKDPNAGGDAALQKFFSEIYGNADPDTKKAMIKSFTESGGTTLSTDWSSIGKEKTPTRPPEGMEAKKF